MRLKPCIYVEKACPGYSLGCSEACSEEEMARCGIAAERQKLAGEDCPVMIANKFSGQVAKCNMPLFREITPTTIPCNHDGECLLVKVKEVGDYIATDSALVNLNRLTNKELKKIRQGIMRDLRAFEITSSPNGRFQPSFSA